MGRVIVRPRVPVILATVALALAGCAGQGHSATPKTTITKTVAPKDQRYDSIGRLHQAVVAAGLPCGDYEVRSGDEQVRGSVGSADCNDDIVIMVYRTSKAAEDGAAGLFFPCNGYGPKKCKDLFATDLLLGPNWLINCGDTTVDLHQIQAKLGGTVIHWDGHHANYS